jgi:hypothetical protein
LYTLLYTSTRLPSTDLVLSPPEKVPPFASNIILIFSQPVHASLITYPVSQSHFAYRLVGTVDPVITDTVNHVSEYHHPN